MATCPECDAEIEVDEFDVDKGDLISCPDCGSNLEVIGLSPVELEMADDEDEDDDDDEDDEKLGDDDEDDVDDVGGSLLLKASALEARLTALGSVLVAYSGGVDSAFLAVTATRILGERAICVTADSPSYPDHHRDLAIGT